MTLGVVRNGVGYYLTIGVLRGDVGYYVTLGVLCDRERSRCNTPNSECRPDGDNTGQSRCQCLAGHVRIRPGETEACGELGTSSETRPLML